jgi:hypothetical protein
VTALAGLVHAGRVYLAGDSALTDSETGTRHATADPKVWRQGAFALSYCGAVGFDRALAAVEWRDEPRWFEHYALDSIVAQVLKRGLDVDDCEALIGYRGRLYHYEALGLWRAGHAYDAAGSGSEVILGYLSCPDKRPPAARVRGAVLAASRHVEGVGGRVRVVSV